MHIYNLCKRSCIQITYVNNHMYPHPYAIVLLSTYIYIYITESGENEEEGDEEGILT